METLYSILDIFLHLDTHLDEMVRNYGPWIYLILFVVIFCETGLVVTPFLPGDSLIFAVGALCGVGSLNLGTSILLLLSAAVVGDAVNYSIGHWVGPKVFRQEKSRWFNVRHLERAHAFMEKYGGRAIVLARFAPIIRTFAPFVAGAGRMTYYRFFIYNVAGAAVWVLGFIIIGFYFGNMPVVKRNFSLVIIAIIVISTLPAVIEYLRHRSNRSAPSKGA